MYTGLNPQCHILDPNDTTFHLTDNTHYIEGTIVAKTKEGGEKKVSQKAMVQSALDKCGWEAKPHEMQGHIKETFGVELAPNIISNYKSQLKREGRLPGGGARARKAGSLQVEDFQMIRSLVSRLGADQVKKLVDVVG